MSWFKKVLNKSAHWEGPFTSILGPEMRYISDEDGRFLAEVNDGGNRGFSVWSNGAGYGTYQTKEAAMKAAEKSSRRLL